MNSTMLNIKKMLSNRNTVAILAALIGVIILFVAYSFRVNQAVKPEKVPVAKETIQPRVKITRDMFEYRNMPKASIDTELVITNVEELVDYYTRVNAVIPKGSMFYKVQIVSAQERPDAYVDQLEEGEVLSMLPLSGSATYGNSIFPGSFVDIYVDMDEAGKVVIGRFIKDVKILAVVSGQRNVFENSEEILNPTHIIFALPSDMRRQLRGAEVAGRLGGSGVSINITVVPVQVPSELVKDLKPSIANKTIEEKINDLIEEIPADELERAIIEKTIEDDKEKEE